MFQPQMLIIFPKVFLSLLLQSRLTDPHPESLLDNYKRGAFLQKADRFVKGKPTVVADSNKPSSSVQSKPPQDRAVHERYHILHKKVEELEKVHLEDKKIVRYSFYVACFRPQLSALASC